MLSILLLLACGPSDKADDSGPTGTTPTTSGEGTLALSFRMDADYLPQMEEDPVGTFYGAFWRGSEVSALGPDDGAEDLGSIRVDLVDLTPDGGPTAVLFTSGPLPVDDEVVVLGFLDSDGNANPDSPDPDNKDPVTLPNDNYFQPVGDTEVAVEVFFGLLNP